MYNIIFYKNYRKNDMNAKMGDDLRERHKNGGKPHFLLNYQFFIILYDFI